MLPHHFALQHAAAAHAERSLRALTAHLTHLPSTLASHHTDARTHHTLSVHSTSFLCCLPLHLLPLAPAPHLPLILPTHIACPLPALHCVAALPFLRTCTLPCYPILATVTPFAFTHGWLRGDILLRVTFSFPCRRLLCRPSSSFVFPSAIWSRRCRDTFVHYTHDTYLYRIGEHSPAARRTRPTLSRSAVIAVRTRVVL